MFRLQVVVLIAVALASSAVKSSNEVFELDESPIGENDLIPASGVNPTFLRYTQKDSLTKDVSPIIDIPWENGKREDFDRLLVRYKSVRFESDAPFTIELSESFEFGASITYIKYVISQSTNECTVAITSGGNGQNFAAVEIEGRNTFYLNYSADYYGK